MAHRVVTLNGKQYFVEILEDQGKAIITDPNTKQEIAVVRSTSPTIVRELTRRVNNIFRTLAKHAENGIEILTVPRPVERAMPKLEVPTPAPPVARTDSGKDVPKPKKKRNKRQLTPHKYDVKL